MHSWMSSKVSALSLYLSCCAWMPFSLARSASTRYLALSSALGGSSVRRFFFCLCSFDCCLILRKKFVVMEVSLLLMVMVMMTVAVVTL